MAQSAAAGVRSMNQYETIMWEKEMRERILSHAHALYGESYPQGTIFDVIHTNPTTSSDDSTLLKSRRDIHLIVWTSQGKYASWKDLTPNQNFDTAAAGLKALLMALQLRLSDCVIEKSEAMSPALA